MIDPLPVPQRPLCMCNDGLLQVINTHDNNGKTAPQTAGKGPRRPKKATAAYVEKAAFAYLQRFAASQAHLANILHRKINRRVVPEGTAPEETGRWVDDTVAKCVRLGLVDDAVYAQQRARRLQHQGRPTRYITMDLRRKGIADALIAAALAGLEEDGAADLRAALRLMQRRRLGYFRVSHRGKDQPEDLYRKDLAALARAGFPYDLARRVLAASRRSAEAVLYGETDQLDGEA